MSQMKWKNYLEVLLLSLAAYSFMSPTSSLKNGSREVTAVDATTVSLLGEIQRQNLIYSNAKLDVLAPMNPLLLDANISYLTNKTNNFLPVVEWGDFLGTAPVNFNKQLLMEMDLAGSQAQQNRQVWNASIGRSVTAPRSPANTMPGLSIMRPGAADPRQIAWGSRDILPIASSMPLTIKSPTVTTSAGNSLDSVPIETSLIAPAY